MPDLPAVPATYTADGRADVRAIRHDLADDLLAAGVSAARVDDVIVMTSELIANVLDHTDSAAAVTVTREDRRVTVSVADHSGEVPVLRPADPTRIGGNGLRIVDVLADAWGTIRHPGDGKAVWFSLRLV